MITPRAHYAEASRLLEGIDHRDLHQSWAAARIAKAQCHAMLAMCPEGYADQPEPESPNGYRDFPTLETRTAKGGRL